MKPIQHAACLCALSALLALSPAVALCENTPAENRQAEDGRLQTGKQANLRKLPNKKSDKLETLKKGSVLTVISVSEINGENWAYVRVQSGREGYILYELLEPVPTPTPEPTATPTPTPSPVPTATPEPGSETPEPTAEPSGVKDEIAYDEPRLVRTIKRANLRKKPAGSRLGEIAANPALTVVGEVEKDGELWLHVEKGKDHREGYMLSELVRQVKPVELIPITEGEVRALFPVIGRDPIADIKNEIPFTYTEEELAQALTEGTYTLAGVELRPVANDPECFLMPWVSERTENITRYSNSAYDTLLSIIASAQDSTARSGCLHDAEALLLEDGVLAPLYTTVTGWQLRETLTGLWRDGRGWFRFTGVVPRAV